VCSRDNQWALLCRVTQQCAVGRHHVEHRDTVEAAMHVLGGRLPQRLLCQSAKLACSGPGMEEEEWVIASDI
jgi:hypothetical protein